MEEQTYKPMRDARGRILPGYSGNMKGRPRGTTITERIRQHLEDPDEMRAFIQELLQKNKDLIWQMLEGRPHQTEDIEHKFPQNLTDLFRGITDNTTASNPSEEDKA